MNDTGPLWMRRLITCPSEVGSSHTNCLSAISLFIECLISLVQSSPHLVQISSPSSDRVNICCTNWIKVLSATINSRSLHASSSNCKSILNHPESIHQEIQRPTESTHGLESVPSKLPNTSLPVDPRVRPPTSGCAMP